MSIQQSVNQSISGSLFLLNQTDAFKRMKAIKDAKRDAETQSKINEITGKADNTGSVPREQLSVTGEGASANNAQQRQITSHDVRNMLAHGLYPKDISQDKMKAALEEYLGKSVQEAEQAKKMSEEFRKMVMQGVYRKEDKWDGK